MRYYLLIPLTLSTILFIGCEEKSEESESKNMPIAINKIEKNITNKETNLGCGNRDNNVLEECTLDEIDSAKFILSTLKKDLNRDEESNITLIKERLHISLKEIVEEENKKSKLKDSLEALVNELSENKKKNLENFVNQINDEFENTKEQRANTFSHNKIATIKDELTILIAMEDTTVKPKVVKKRLETLIADMTESTKSLHQTEKSLKNLVKDAEKRDTPSVEKFASAIIEDVSNKKITIVKENEEYLIIKVQQGDNLSLLAERYYNDTSKYKLIYEANKDKISEGYDIYPGTELFIPKI